MITGVAAAVLVACGALALVGATSPADSKDPVRVMFLGDSITGSPGCWRAEVWRQLTNDGYSVDMVGPRTADECGGVTNDAGVLWDPDNAGIGGATTFEMINHIGYDGLAEKNPAELYVILLGTNDVRGNFPASKVLEQYTFLVTLIREETPDATFVFGTLPPIGPSDCTDCQAVIDELNPQMPEWAEGVSTTDSPVTIAVIHEGMDPAIDTYDDLHPNDSGNAKLAAAWVGPIEEALDGIGGAGEAEASGGLSPWGWAGLAVAVAATSAWAVMRHRPEQPPARRG